MNERQRLVAYPLSKRGNSLRVTAAAVHWGQSGARINTIRPWIVIAPLAKDELPGRRSTGGHFLVDGGVTAAYQYGDHAEVQARLDGMGAPAVEIANRGSQPSAKGLADWFAGQDGS